MGSTPAECSLWKNALFVGHSVLKTVGNRGIARNTVEKAGIHIENGAEIVALECFTIVTGEETSYLKSFGFRSAPARYILEICTSLKTHVLRITGAQQCKTALSDMRFKKCHTANR